jgi:stringent starvation protein B
MKALRPYLLRAVYEWLMDSDQTPYLLVAADFPDVIVPRSAVSDGKVILNISPTAVQELLLSDELIEFNARFSGSPMVVRVPIGAALALYSKETGKGMVFEDEEPEGTPPPPKEKPAKSERPALRVVK